MLTDHLICCWVSEYMPCWHICSGYDVWLFFSSFVMFLQEDLPKPGQAPRPAGAAVPGRTWSPSPYGYGFGLEVVMLSGFLFLPALKIFASNILIESLRQCCCNVETLLDKWCCFIEWLKWLPKLVSFSFSFPVLLLCLEAQENCYNYIQADIRDTAQWLWLSFVGRNC